MNKKISIIILIMYTFLFSFSCNFMDFSQLEVSTSLPENGGFFNEECITVDFSLEVEEISLKEIVVLQRNGVSISSEVQVDERGIFIKPVEPWQKGASYSLHIEGAVELVEGGSHQVYFYGCFIYGPPEKSFSLVDWAAPSAKAPYLALEFSLPVDSALFFRNFSLSPSLGYTYELVDEGCGIRILPQEDWESNQRFTWTVSNLESETGFLLDKKYEGDFIYRIDTEIPILEGIFAVEAFEGESYIKGVQENTLREKQALLLSFSKEMDFDSLEAGLRLEPSCAGELRQGNNHKEFLWVPEENWSLGEEYRVVVSAEVQDVSGISLAHQEEAYFTVAEDFLQITTIGLADEFLELQKLETTKAYDVVLQDETASLVTTIQFNQPLEPENLVEALESISMDVLFPLTAAYPVLDQVRYHPQTGFVLHWSGFSPSNHEVDNFYQLKIAGGLSGIQTSAGNYLKEDVWVTIRVVQP